MSQVKLHFSTHTRERGVYGSIFAVAFIVLVVLETLVSICFCKPAHIEKYLYSTHKIKPCCGIERIDFSSFVFVCLFGFFFYHRIYVEKPNVYVVDVENSIRFIYVCVYSLYICGDLLVISRSKDFIICLCICYRRRRLYV